MQPNGSAEPPTGPQPVDINILNEQSTSETLSTRTGVPQLDQHTHEGHSAPNTKQNSRQKLNRTRDKARESWKALVRALSLSLVLHAFRGLRYPRGRGLHEPTKIAIRHNRQIALLRALVHLVPFGFALFEIILNWNVYYVGSSSYSTAAYQIIAKAHEILIQASIATIIFSATRRELALGKGLPFGLLFSGLQTSQISYLWSIEFWGAVRAEFPRPLRKAALLSLVIGSIVVAVTSGPASAVLLIPRRQSWPAGSTHIWLNATTNQLWPTRQVSTLRQGAYRLMFGRIDGAFVPQACSTVGTDTSNECPASEWHAIRDYLTVRQVRPGFFSERFGVVFSTSDPCTIHGQATTRSLYLEQNYDLARPGPTPRLATTPHSVVADALAQVATFWGVSLINVTADAGHGSPLSDQTNAEHTIASNYSQPYSSVVCFPDQFMVGSDFNHVAFPMLPFTNRPNAATRDRAWNNTGVGRAVAEVSQVIEHPDHFYSQLLDPTDDIQAYRTRWIELPGDVFNGSSIGAAILLPRAEQDPVQDVVLCNVAAGWGRSSLVVSTNGKASDRGMVSTFQEGRDLKAVTVPIGRGFNPEAQSSNDQFVNAFQYLDLPRRLINISASWAQYLDPLVPNHNTSLLDMLIRENTVPGHQPAILPDIIVMLFANGLARTGWDSTLQGELKTIGPNGEGSLDGNSWVKGKGDLFDVDPTGSQDWVTFRVESTLDGYAYNVMTPPPRIAIAILTGYLLLVVGHTLYSGITGISSNCWDTIAEVTALAVNSTPTAALRNTCAGISEFHIFKLPVRILVSKDEEGEGEHLELVFGQTDEEKVEERTIQANRTYGTLPKGCDAEGKKEV